MKPVPYLAAGIAAVFAGCATVSTQFGGTWPLPVERQSSAAIDLARPMVTSEGAGYVIVGHVNRKFGAPTTAHSHVDIQLVGANGAVLTEKSVNFEPRELPPRLRLAAPSAEYKLRVSEAPAGTARIKVIAHDQEHSSA